MGGSHISRPQQNETITSVQMHDAEIAALRRSKREGRHVTHLFLLCRHALAPYLSRSAHTLYRAFTHPPLPDSFHKDAMSFQLTISRIDDLPPPFLPRITPGGPTRPERARLGQGSHVFDCEALRTFARSLTVLVHCYVFSTGFSPPPIISS